MLKGLLAIIFVATTTLLSAQHEDIRLEIKRIVLNDTEFTFKETPGFIVAIIDGDETYNLEFGYTTLAEDQRLKDTDVFEIGSLSKVMTASLVGLLVDQGKLNYEDLVNDLLPDKYSNPRLESLTLQDLVHHTSGLPTRPSFFGLKNTDPGDPYKYYRKDDLLTFYRDFVPSQEDKSESKYAHTNYGLIEVILEHQLEGEYGLLLKEHLFDPLGMDQSFVTFLENRDSIVTTGYDRALRPATPWSFASFGASEGVKTSLNDLVKYIKAHLHTSGTYLDGKFDDNIKGQAATNFNEYILAGNGWQIVEQKRKFDIVTHTGKTSGHHAFAAFISETKTGVIVLSNSSLGTQNLGYLILRMINHNWKRKTP